MPKLTRLLILGCSLAATGGSAMAQAPATPVSVAQQSAHELLFRLFSASDEAYLRRNPLQALYRGDMRYADGLGDLFSDAHYQAEKAAAEHDLQALHSIPRDQLTAPDQLAYDAFEYQMQDT